MTKTVLKRKALTNLLAAKGMLFCMCFFCPFTAMYENSLTQIENSYSRIGHSLQFAKLYTKVILLTECVTVFAGWVISTVFFFLSEYAVPHASVRTGCLFARRSLLGNNTQVHPYAYMRTVYPEKLMAKRKSLTLYMLQTDHSYRFIKKSCDILLPVPMSSR